MTDDAGVPCPRRATLVFIFVGCICGPEDAGVLSLALGYLAILTTLFTGLDDLLIREVTAAPKRVTALLLAYAVLRLPLTALLSVVVLLIGQAGSQLSPEQMLALRLIVSSAVLDALAGLGQIVLYAFGGFRLLVLPAAVTRRLAVEAGATQCWWRYVGSTGRVLGIDRFGASGKAADLFREYGLTAANVTQAVEALLAG